MSKPDGYYGSIAANYDASREVKAKWKAEIAAVEMFVDRGPVLDVPFGTGRFVPIYRRKGIEYQGVDVSADMLAQARLRHGDVNARLGSIYDIAAPEVGTFATVVCVRFLEWLPVEEAKGVLAQLRTLGETLVVTITHGIEAKPEAYVYDWNKFLGAIDGLLIEDRRETARVRGMISECLKLRPARWSDVLHQFSFDHAGAEAENIQRIADKHCDLFGWAHVTVDQRSKVRAQYWSGERLAGVVAQHERLTVDDPPRHSGGPLTVVQVGSASLLIDGRRRANRMMKEAGPHPVLVVHPHG